MDANATASPDDDDDCRGPAVLPPLSEPAARDTCSICLVAETIDRFYYFKSSCRHPFHVSCIKPWLEKNRRTTCPNCRRKVDPESLAELKVRVVDHQRLSANDDYLTESEQEANDDDDLTESEQEEEENEDEDSNIQLPVPDPLYYERCIRPFIESHSDEDNLEIVRELEDRPGARYTLCENVHRAKVFLALDPEFRFDPRELFHTCGSFPDSVFRLQNLYLDWTHPSSSSTTTTTTTETTHAAGESGTAYDFFALNTPGRVCIMPREFETVFREEIRRVFGLYLPVRRRNQRLRSFYQYLNPNYRGKVCFVLRYARDLQRESLCREENYRIFGSYYLPVGQQDERFHSYII